MTASGRPDRGWEPHLFEPKIERWQNEEHPPPDAVARVRAWWPSLLHAPRLIGRPSPGRPGVRYAWVADCVLPDLGDGHRGVQCHYRVEGRQVVCQFFAIAPLTRNAADG